MRYEIDRVLVTRGDMKTRKEYRWRLIAKNGRVVGASSESFRQKAGVLHNLTIEQRVTVTETKDGQATSVRGYDDKRKRFDRPVTWVDNTPETGEVLDALNGAGILS